jgi:lipoprotein-anchoring transpeptidase ErfK/SrfK
MKRIEVTSSNQKLVAYEGNKRVFEFDCVLGDDQTPTRAGYFSIKRKHRDHVSSQSGHPMPYAMFFDEGRAIHGATHVEIRHLAMRTGLGKLDNITPESAKIGSHGCINLKKEDAAAVFQWAQEGTLVIVR